MKYFLVFFYRSLSAFCVIIFSIVSMRSFVILIVSMLYLHVVSSEFINRANYGVIFDDLGQISVITDSWHHTIVVNLPENFDKIIEFEAPSCGEERDYDDLTDLWTTVKHNRQLISKYHCELLQKEISETNEVRNKIITFINDTITDIKHNIPYVLDPQDVPVKRDLISAMAGGIFSVAKFFLGERNLKNHLAKVQDRVEAQEKKAHLLENTLSGFAKFTRHKISSLERNISRNTQQIQSIQDYVYEEFQSTQKINVFTHHVIQDLYLVQNLALRISELKQALSQLADGHLNSYLMSFKEFLHLKYDVEISLRKQNLKYNVLQLDARQIYDSKFLPISYSRIRNDIYVTLHLPLTDRHFYQAYEINVFNVPTGINSFMKLDSTNISKFLYYSEIDNSYFTSQNSLVQKGLLQDDHIKHGVSSLQSCEIALLHDIRSEVLSLCTFKIFQTPAPPQLFRLDLHNLLVINMESVQIHHQKSTDSLSGCSYCILTFDCHDLGTKNVRHYSYKHDCSGQKTSQNIVFKYHVAIPFLTTFYNANIKNNIAANFYFSEEPNIDYEHIYADLEDNLNYDSEFLDNGISIADLYIANMTNQPSYQSIEAKHDKQLQDISAERIYKLIIISMITLVIIILSFCISCLILRLNKLTAVINGINLTRTV